MKKHAARFLALFLAVCLTASLTALPAHAEDQRPSVYGEVFASIESGGRHDVYIQENPTGEDPGGKYVYLDLLP